jgi:hypothetical protein
VEGYQSFGNTGGIFEGSENLYFVIHRLQPSARTLGRFNYHRCISNYLMYEVLDDTAAQIVLAMEGGELGGRLRSNGTADDVLLLFLIRLVQSCS